VGVLAGAGAALGVLALGVLGLAGAGAALAVLGVLDSAAPGAGGALGALGVLGFAGSGAALGAGSGAALGAGSGAALGAGAEAAGSGAAGALVAALVAPAAADCAVSATDPLRADPPATAIEAVCKAKSAATSALVTASRTERATRRSLMPNPAIRPPRTSSVRNELCASVAARAGLKPLAVRRSTSR
jgi:hypothetical protein